MELTTEGPAQTPLGTSQSASSARFGDYGLIRLLDYIIISLLQNHHNLLQAIWPVTDHLDPIIFGSPVHNFLKYLDLLCNILSPNIMCV